MAALTYQSAFNFLETALEYDRNPRGLLVSSDGFIRKHFRCDPDTQGQCPNNEFWEKFKGDTGISEELFRDRGHRRDSVAFLRVLHIVHRFCLIISLPHGEGELYAVNGYWAHLKPHLPPAPTPDELLTSRSIRAHTNWNTLRQKLCSVSVVTQPNLRAKAEELGDYLLATWQWPCP